MNLEIKRKLQKLELSDLMESIEEVENNVQFIDCSFDDKLSAILDLLINKRYNKLVKKLIRLSELRYLNASYESLNIELRHINKNIIESIINLSFVDQSSNIFITGPTGCGKTYLACVIGIEACKKTYRTYYIRMQDLQRKIEEVVQNPKELKKFIRKLSNYKILIIDEWLTYKPTEREIKFFYELFELRYSVNSTIFVSQFDKSEWHEKLGGGIQADSIMDRIIHNSYTIPSNSENLREHYDKEKIKNIIKSD